MINLQRYFWFHFIGSKVRGNLEFISIHNTLWQSEYVSCFPIALYHLPPTLPPPHPFAADWLKLVTMLWIRSQRETRGFVTMPGQKNKGQAGQRSPCMLTESVCDVTWGNRERRISQGRERVCLSVNLIMASAHAHLMWSCWQGSGHPQLPRRSSSTL